MTTIHVTIRRGAAALMLSLLLSPGFQHAPVFAAGKGSGGEGLEADPAARLGAMKPEEQILFIRSLDKGVLSEASRAFHLGNAMYSLGKADSAEYYFRRAVEADSAYSKAYVNLGVVLDERGKFTEAEIAFKKAIRLNPRDVLAYCHLGYLYYSRQKYAKAMDGFRKALALDPGSAQAHYYMGLVFADAHIFGEALREWEEVVKLEPDSELGRNARENVKLIKKYLAVKVP